MPFPVELRMKRAVGGEDKSAQIQGAVATLRRRINLLALQALLFETAALIIGAGGAVLMAAFKLRAAAFAIALPMIAGGTLVGLFLIIRKATWSLVTTYQAARIADRRAFLKGRLATLFAMRDSDRDSALMPYLIEDTMSLREEFDAGRIEPRRVSRSLGYLAAAGAIGAAAFVLAGRLPAASIASKDEPGEITVPLEDMDVRLAGPGMDADTEVSADPETMAKLQEKAAEAGANGFDGPIQGLAGKAQSLAGALQDKLTGRKQLEGARIRLRLAEALESKKALGEESADQKKASKPSAQKGGGGVFDKREDSARSGPLPPIDPAEPEEQNDEAAGGAATAQNAKEAAAGNDSDQHENAEAGHEASAEDSGSASASHGGGSDPEHLFGRASVPPVSAESFEIMIAARPTQSGSADQSHSYLPPRIRASLSPEQHADEPIARTPIPAEDRETVKRVFER
jgi:hypothetical protein